MRFRNIVAVALLAVTVTFGAGSAKAKARPSGPVKKNPKLEPKGDPTKKSGVKRQRGNLFVLEDIKIEGKVYKPQAFHVINRKELNLEWDVRDPRFKKSFLDTLVDAVRGSPF